MNTGPCQGPGRLVDRSGILRGDDDIARYVDRPASLVHAARTGLEREPGAAAVVELGGPRWTYAQLWERAARVAGGLRAGGVRRGDRVLLARPNSAVWCAAFLGAVFAGAVAVPVDVRLSAAEIAELARDCAARIVVGKGALPDGEPVVTEDAVADDIAAIFYTSGTTGRPKGAVTTHANFLSNIETTRRLLRRGDPEPPRELISVPLSHVTGCNSQFLPTLEAGGTTVIMPRFDVGVFLNGLQDERITSVMSVPSVFAMVLAGSPALEEATASVRSLTYGGAPADLDLVRRLRRAFPAARLGSGYGMTECASFAAHLPDEYVDTRPGAVGLPVPVVDLALREPEDEGGTAVGELCVRGPNVARGYWDDPEATGSTFLEGGWLRTGDLASIDPDGVVAIAGRSKDVIIRGGQNVHAAEVERVIGAHPHVAEVAVVGVPDAVAGEKVAAVLVPAHPDLDLRAVVRAARERLARHKVPDLVEVRDHPLPRNAGGKVVKAGIGVGATWRVAPR